MGRKKRGTRKVIFCYYCMKTFTDEKSLVEHQKSKHFRCPACNKKMNAAGALYVHCNQVHKNQLDKVPNAIDGHDTFEVDVYGMQHVPESAIHEYMEMHGMGEQVQRAKKARNDHEVAERQAAASAAATPPPSMPAPFPQAFPPQPYGMYHTPQPNTYYPGMQQAGGYGAPPPGMPGMQHHGGYAPPQGMPGMQQAGGYGAHPGMQQAGGFPFPPGIPGMGASQGFPAAAHGAAPAAAQAPAYTAAAPAHTPPVLPVASMPQAAHAAAAVNSTPAHSAAGGGAPLPPGPLPAAAAAAPPALSATSAGGQPASTHSSTAKTGGAATASPALSASTFGRHAVAGKDSILVYGDDVLSPEERRASLPKYTPQSAGDAASKLRSLDSDLQGRLAQALS